MSSAESSLASMDWPLSRYVSLSYYDRLDILMILQTYLYFYLYSRDGLWKKLLVSDVG